MNFYHLEAALISKVYLWFMQALSFKPLHCCHITVRTLTLQGANSDPLQAVLSVVNILISCLRITQIILQYLTVLSPCDHSGITLIVFCDSRPLVALCTYLYKNFVVQFFLHG